MLKERKIQKSEEGLAFSQGSKQLSLRDPAGTLFESQGRLFRLLSKAGWETFQKINGSLVVKRFIREGKLVDSKVLNEKEESEILKTLLPQHELLPFEIAKIIEHPKIEFVAYPHEWCSEMLKDSGLLTIELAEKLLHSKMGIKDGSPFNIVFDFGKPLFVDILSLEERNTHDPIWKAYGQFSKSFINTLFLSHYFDIPFEKSLANYRDGLPTEKVYSLLSTRQKLMPPFLTNITLPVLLSKLHNPKDLSIYGAKSVSEELAEFTLSRLFKRSRTSLLSLGKKQNQARGNRYMQEDLPYSKPEFEEKSTVVKHLLKELSPKKVLDLGANTGHFSLLAEETGASVVSVDSDTHAITELYKAAKKSGLNILPICMDLTSPTPATGWSNEETLSFMTRFEGRFDTCLMLALIHHLLATHSIPLEAIAALASRLTTENLIIEYISPDDSMFQALAHGRNYSHVTENYFEKTFLRHFSIVNCHSMKNSQRKIYHLKKRLAANA